MMSSTREIAKKAVTERLACIRVECQAFCRNESSYCYERRFDAENPEVAIWSIRLVCSMDLMYDQLEDCGTFRLLNLIDDFKREAIGKEIDFSLQTVRVIREPEQII